LMAAILSPQRITCRDRRAGGDIASRPRKAVLHPKTQEGITLKGEKVADGKLTA
jgi:hypothetical protein